ncbi:Na+/Picotransporter [Syntrophobotulus glycolicus DSM 8271]|uniref:Na+/Picotransporter n=1 Tax=Syntrophobotulus glycolicus (strain DSM 8271 / FlGlyR) TaxID=645991 RepID=F0T1Q5_SYNGF|nr:Na/Pi cotransporter family protein [Syntrophobotulus glycolicus]ADY57479.1 Na+/Picotransporter [Syntrophobotulus glycolicus DSM 8271]
MITVTMVMQFLGGMGLFLYGVNATSEGLQKIAANRLKKILESLTKKTLTAAFFGMVMTIALQSSAATTVMVVEFVNSGLMTLAQALGVALGSSVGTSIVILLISFPILNIALAMIFIGFILYLVIRTTQTKRIGQAMIGFGCIFVGMSYLSSAFAPFRNIPEVNAFLSGFGDNPVLGILVSTVFTALLQSSSAFMAILISLSTQGLLTVEAVVPLVMGAHIGGTVTTLVSALSAEKTDAKRVALANSIYRVAAALIVFPFFSQFSALLVWSSPYLPMQVANAHLFSAILMVVLFLPFNKLIANALIKIIPQPKGRDKELRNMFITKTALELPVVALSQVYQEIRWLSHQIMENMVDLLPRVMYRGEQRWADVVEQSERNVDWHYRQITDYITAIFRRNLIRQQIFDSQNYLLMAKEFEYIADNLVVMTRYIMRMHNEKIKLTERDSAMFDELYILNSNHYLAILSDLDNKTRSNSYEVINKRQEVIGIFHHMRENAISFQYGSAPSSGSEGGKSANSEFEPGRVQIDCISIMIDLINGMYNISEEIFNIARIIVGQETDGEGHNHELSRETKKGMK